MNISLKIKNLLHEAELYHSQGLLSEAGDKYHAMLNVISGLQNLKNKDVLIKGITEKLDSIDKVHQKVAAGPASPELSEKGQNLIKNLFGENELEKAIALAKFGQFERAVIELTALLKKQEFRVEAAKNILRCRIAMGTVDDAVDQYHKWFSTDMFPPAELDIIRGYLHRILEQKGIEAFLPTPVAAVENAPAHTTKEGSLEGISFHETSGPQEEMLDITSIGITFTSGEQSGKMIEFDVNFQSGNVLSLIVPRRDRGLLEGLKEGDVLEDVQFYSPIAFFTGTAVVKVKTQIESGPKQGDFCLDLKISTH